MEADAPRLSVRAAVVDDLALGTMVKLVVTRPAGLKAAKVALDAVVARIDAACSHLRQESELSRLNARAGQEVHVSPLLAAALAAALRAARLSGGAVDPTAGPGLRLAAAGPGHDGAPAGGSLWLAAPAASGWRRIRFDLGRRLVRLPADVELELGPTARALATDMAAGAAL
ncbi:MAG: FAD:protein FMN transferase, partial [Candidatus Dormibacterales bacterium]